MSLSTLNHLAAAGAGIGKPLSPAAPAAARSVRLLPKARLPAPVSAATASARADPAEDRVSALSQVSGVLGSQWGDEGKGKLVDVLAPRFDVVARCQVRGCVYVSFVRIRSVALLIFSMVKFCCPRRE